MESKKTKDKNYKEEEEEFDSLDVENTQLSKSSKLLYLRQSKKVLVFVVLSVFLIIVTICKFHVGVGYGIKGEEAKYLQKQIHDNDDHMRMLGNELLSPIRSSELIRDSSSQIIIRNAEILENHEDMYEKTKFSFLLENEESFTKSKQEIVESKINLESENQRKISLYEANFEQYRIKPDFEKDIPNDNRDELEKHGFHQNIQLASNFDYLNITKSEMFKKVRNEWESYFPYETFDILPNPAYERDPGLIELTNTFTSEESIKNYILEEGNKLNKRVLDTTIFGLAVLLSTYPNDKLIQEIEYLYFNDKYKIGEISTELPICVFSIGYNVKSKNKHQEFFESLERQNYTNYKLVIVDDDSIDGSAEFFYNLINESKLKLRNRAHIIHNLKRVGSTGNLMMRSKKFCDKDDIIVNIDTDDKFIGNQVFKIINAIYQNENIWSAFSRFIFRDLMKNIEFLFHSTVIPDNYRAAIDNWSTTHLKTYRHKIVSKIPLEYFIEYHFNEEVGMLEPHFFKSASDRYMVYSIIELSGLDRVFFIDAVFYYYYYFPDTDPNCYRSHQRVDEYKARIKTPLKKLDSLDGDAMPLEEYKVPEDLLFEMSKFFKVYQECLYIKKTRDLTVYQFKDPLKNTAEKLYNCKNFTLILSNTEKLNENISSIHAKTIYQWVFNNHSIEEQEEFIKKSLHKCAIVIDLEFESYMLHYPEFEYVIVATEEFNLLEGHLNRYIKSKKLSNNVSVERMEVSPKVYAVIKFYKKMETTLTGAWNGNDRSSIAKYFSPSVSSFLEKALIEFYTMQKSKKILDIGCGLCLYAPAFKAAKMVLTAYDGNPYTEELSNRTASVRDFSEKVYLGTKFDWVQSFNVGEYIPLTKFHNFINNLVHHATKGIILAWETHDNLSEETLGLRNPQTNNQIVKIMKEHGFLIDSGLTSDFRSREGLESFNTTLMIFKRK